MAQNSWLNPINNILGAASSYYHGYPQNQPSHNNASYQHIPNQAHYSQSTPLNPQPYCSPSTPGHPSLTSSHKTSAALTTHRKALSTVKRYSKLLSTASLIISTLLTLFMEASMIYTLAKYFRTKDTPSSDYTRSSPWATHTVLWPSYMLLAASGITMLLCLGNLLVTCCRWRKAKAGFSLLYNGTHILVWVGVTVLYRLFKTEKDLWGWSCSDKSSEIQDVFKEVVDFGGLCKIQTTDWHTSIAEVVVKTVTSGGGWYLKTRGSRIRKYITDQIGDAGIEDFF